jgi:hypothetical protein
LSKLQVLIERSLETCTNLHDSLDASISEISFEKHLVVLEVAVARDQADMNLDSLKATEFLEREDPVAFAFSDASSYNHSALNCCDVSQKPFLRKVHGLQPVFHPEEVKESESTEAIRQYCCLGVDLTTCAQKVESVLQQLFLCREQSMFS